MNLKLGKLPVKHDKRTIRMSSILRSELAPPPESFDVDAIYPGCDTPMFLNDRIGDCVIASRAHMTRRFEMVETHQVLTITDEEVKQEYFMESGGADSGLVMLDSLNAWRQGWPIGQSIYTIDAFSKLNHRSELEIKQAIFLLAGAYAGVVLPASAMNQFNNGETWDNTFMDRFRDPAGGHAIYLCGFDPEGITCITWGRKQKMTWDWFLRNADECYGVIDSADRWLVEPGIDTDKLKQYLRDITT